MSCLGDCDGNNRYDPHLVDIPFQPDDQRGIVSVSAYLFTTKLVVFQVCVESMLLIFPYFCGGIFNIFLICQFISGIPKELDEAAIIGCLFRSGMICCSRGFKVAV